MFLKTSVPFEKNKIAQCLYDLISDLPQGEDRSVFLRQHSFMQAWRRKPSLPAGYEYVGADPDARLLMHLKDTMPYDTEREPFFLETNPDCFTQLPTELVRYLVAFLDSQSLCNFRLSSKVIASLTHPNDLPQAFWASRFAADNEMGFFPLDWEVAPVKSNWRQIYLSLKENLQDCSKIGHMRNRRRIWNCIRHLWSPLNMMLRQTPDLQSIESLHNDIVLQGLHITEMTQSLAKLKPLRQKGSQLLTLAPQSYETEGLRISISTITLNSTDYICGLRILRRDEKDDGEEISRVGFVLTGTETHLYTCQSVEFTAIRVAASFGGILGIGFQIRDAIGQVLWYSVGQLEDLPAFAGVVTLKPRTASRISGLIISFDVSWTCHYSSSV
jgi:hypothetical protein